jgi:addiction module HigA family antidote
MLTNIMCFTTLPPTPCGDLYLLYLLYVLIIKSTYLTPLGYSRFSAKQLDVASSTLNRILKGQSGITPELALRLSKSLGRSSDTWLVMQDKYDLWYAKKMLNYAMSMLYFLRVFKLGTNNLDRNVI